MTKAAKNQTLVTTWGRIVLGAFVFGWLNAAAQPCMMAIELAAEPAAQSAHAGHGMHQDDPDAAQGGGSNCGHCPPAGAGGHQSACATIQAADCDDSSSASVDSRQLEFKLKYTPGMFAISQGPPIERSFRPDSSFAPPACVSPRFANGPSSRLRYCVFLK